MHARLCLDAVAVLAALTVLPLFRVLLALRWHGADFLLPADTPRLDETYERTDECATVVTRAVDRPKIGASSLMVLPRTGWAEVTKTRFG